MMMLKQIARLSLLLLCGLLIVGQVSAQEIDLTEVYVTTQDYAALRAGPGRHWDKLAVLPYGATYRATGRTIDAQWLQIAYEGELLPDARGEFTVNGVTYGWVAYWLLTWTGNILTLPIDGVSSVPIAREAGPLLTLGPGLTDVYTGDVVPSARVESPITSPVRVEVTGRLGSVEGGYFWLQFKYNYQYYWIPTWVVGVPRGYLQVPDAAYLYPYGRLLIQLRVELGRAGEVLSDIGGRWGALDAGQTTTCNAIPDDFTLRESSFNAFDLSREPLYQPTAEALTNAQASINAALAKFRAVCARGDSDRLVSPEEISAAFLDLDEAQRNLTIARTLLAPFSERDPLLGE
jgi:hypothetical protein